jgi:hypothetical protein
VSGRLLRLAAFVGAHECDEEAREPVREYADAPELEGYAQALALLVVELDWLACADRYEAVDDRVCSWDDRKFREQRVPLGPGDLDQFPIDVDLDSVEAALLHRSGTTQEGRRQ